MFFSRRSMPCRKVFLLSEVNLRFVEVSKLFLEKSLCISRNVTNVNFWYANFWYAFVLWWTSVVLLPKSFSKTIPLYVFSPFSSRHKSCCDLLTSSPWVIEAFLICLKFVQLNQQFQMWWKNLSELRWQRLQFYQKFLQEMITKQDLWLFRNVVIAKGYCGSSLIWYIFAFWSAARSLQLVPSKLSALEELAKYLLIFKRSNFWISFWAILEAFSISSLKSDILIKTRNAGCVIIR